MGPTIFGKNARTFSIPLARFFGLRLHPPLHSPSSWLAHGSSSNIVFQSTYSVINNTQLLHQIISYPNQKDAEEGSAISCLRCSHTKVDQDERPS